MGGVSTFGWMIGWDWVLCIVFFLVFSRLQLIKSLQLMSAMREKGCYEKCIFVVVLMNQVKYVSSLDLLIDIFI